jgi:hypothetical protein
LRDGQRRPWPSRDGPPHRTGRLTVAEMRVYIATIDRDSRARALFSQLAGAGDGAHPMALDPEEADAILFVDIDERRDPLLKALRRHELVRRFRASVRCWVRRLVTSGRPGWVLGRRRADSLSPCRLLGLTGFCSVARRHPRITGVT